MGYAVLLNACSPSGIQGEHMDGTVCQPLGPSLLTRILFRVFNALCCGAILLDRNKVPVHVNPRAQKCFGTAFLAGRGRLSASDRASDILFQTILDQTLKYGAGETEWRREAVPLVRPDHRPIIARVIAVESEAQAQLDGSALIVLLIDPEDCPHPSFSILKQVFDLTRTEARVATDLLCSKTVDDIAEDAHVSAGTVRSQVKAVLAKTQTHRQAELVALLTRLALISESGPNG